MDVASSMNYDRPSQWSKPEQAWLSGTIGPNYEFDYYPVSRFDSEEKRCLFKQRCFGKILYRAVLQV